MNESSHHGASIQPTSAFISSDGETALGGGQPARTTLLRQLKIGALRIARRGGITQLLLDSEWRRKRLTIFCYHGVSLLDEHLWDPAYYITEERFRRRLDHLRRLGAAVLPLDEALHLLRRNQLPGRAVCLTFDDGSADFHLTTRGILEEYGYPVTVYLTSYYAEHRWPVFTPMCAYLLWKGRARTLRLPELGNAPEPLEPDEARAAVAQRIKAYAETAKLSGEEKHHLLGRIAAALDIDYGDLLARRILQLMSPEEVQRDAASGVRFELHTHRHRMFHDPLRMQREIVDNRTRIVEWTGRETRHFCYPSGAYSPDHPALLRGLGIDSATTCRLGMASPGSDAMLLPRVTDTMQLSDLEFEAWVSGMAAILPRRVHVRGQVRT